MALLIVAVYDTEENKRTPLTKRTLESFKETVDFSKHRLFCIDNNSCQETKDLLIEMQSIIPFTIITNDKNVGTAKAAASEMPPRIPAHAIMIGYCQGG